MKKLMIAVAIVCAAAFAQAASYTWSVAGFIQDGDFTGMNGTIEVLSGTTSLGTLSVVDGFISGKSIEFDGPADISWKVTTDSFEEGGTWEKIVTIAGFDHPYPDSGSAADASQSLANLGGALIDQVTDFGNLYFSDSAESQDWKAVPEPTSGLLLLLGVAGLALKRKRA